MKILIIGSGGREHALGWKLSQKNKESEEANTLFFAPGNPGCEALGQRLEIEVSDLQGLLLFAQREKIDLTVVGPEVPLALGIVDLFHKNQLTIFGPSKAGAQLESSKDYAKTLMQKAHIPTAGYVFCDNVDFALQALTQFSPPYVIKQDGLAAGKGVTIAPDRPSAKVAIEESFAKDMPVIIEEFLEGEELSLLAICDGKRAIPMISAQDFKKVGEGNTGPNTGGMGAYTPVPFVTPELLTTIQTDVLDPMLKALSNEGIDFRGVLYAGLMISPDGKANVVEFNVRFGDPETQVVLPLLEDDLSQILLQASEGDLSAYELSGFKFKENQSAVTVVLASEGYPGAYTSAFPIRFPSETPENAIIFHAGTKKTAEQSIVSNGGRVINVTGLGDSLESARKNAYTLAEQVQFENKFCRRDIAEKIRQLV